MPFGPHERGSQGWSGWATGVGAENEESACTRLGSVTVEVVVTPTVVEGVVGGEGVLGLNVAADVLVPGGALSSDGLFTWDYGGGLNLAFLTAPGGSVIDVNPRALVGVNYAFTPKVSGFAELELGPAFNVGTGPITFGIVPDARIGVNFY